MLRRSKLTAPDFERLARTPYPIASLASSGISPLSSALAFSCSMWASRVRRNTLENSAQALDELMSTDRTASIRARGGSTPPQSHQASLPSTGARDAGADVERIRRFARYCARTNA